VPADRRKLADGLIDGGALPRRRYAGDLKAAKAAAFAAATSQRSCFERFKE